MRPFFVLISMNVYKPPFGLFERIISAIRKEQEMRKSRRLLFAFFVLLIVSIVAIPLSGTVLVMQMKNSGISYFIFTAFSNFNISIKLWKDFALAILESLPVLELISFGISLAIAVFTVRLFLYKKKLLLSYLINNFA
jgi:cytochrome b561